MTPTPPDSGTATHGASLTPERFARVRAVFEAALDRRPFERRAFVDGACAGDEALRRDVLGMLSAEAKGDPLLDRPATDTGSSAPDEGRFTAGTVLAGRYRVLGLLGTGGMACHTPPLYTNNALTLASGFDPPVEHRSRYDIMPVSVGTDPDSAIATRRGTGYYKVPSLKGVWYRGPFEHNGSVMALEDWFDARRLKDDYVPTGFKGAGVTTRAVRGHAFGLDLSDDDRRALIAFLKTL